MRNITGSGDAEEGQRRIHSILLTDTAAPIHDTIYSDVLSKLQEAGTWNVVDIELIENAGDVKYYDSKALSQMDISAQVTITH